MSPHMAYLRHSTDREVALMMLMAYLSYMLAEVRFYELPYHFLTVTFKDKVY